jgi:hypothetical protein
MEIPLPPIGPISWIWAGGQTCLSNGACHSWTTASAGGYRLLPSRPNKFVRKYLHLPDPDSKGPGRGWIIDYRLFCTTVLRTVSQAHLARNSSYGRHHRSTVRTRISPRSLAPQEFLSQGPTTSVNRNAPARRVFARPYTVCKGKDQKNMRCMDPGRTGYACVRPGNKHA